MITGIQCASSNHPMRHRLANPVLDSNINMAKSAGVRKKVYS